MAKRIGMIRIEGPHSRVNDKSTALNKKLLAASVYGNLPEMTKLIQEGANVNAQLSNACSETLSILEYTARSHEFEAVKLLIENKALTSDEYKDHSANPLIQAVYAENSEAVKYLLEAKFDPNGKGNTTPLHHASNSGCTDIVKILLEHKANPFQVDNNGENALEALKWVVEARPSKRDSCSSIAVILQEAMDSYEVQDVIVEPAGRTVDSEPG